jgi:hypothetical protein
MVGIGHGVHDGRMHRGGIVGKETHGQRMAGNPVRRQVGKGWGIFNNRLSEGWGDAAS